MVGGSARIGSVREPLFKASSTMCHAISQQPPERFVIPMAHSNGVIPGIHFRGQKKESGD
jgi:hypothetical protein